MSRRTAVFVWAALLVVPFAFLGVALTVADVHADPALAGPILALAAAASEANVALAWTLPRLLGPDRAQERDAVAFARALVALALGEAAAITPVVAYVLARDGRLLAVLAASVAALAALYPSGRRWEALRPLGDGELAAADAAPPRKEAP